MEFFDSWRQAINNVIDIYVYVSVNVQPPQCAERSFTRCNERLLDGYVTKILKSQYIYG